MSKNDSKRQKYIAIFIILSIVLIALVLLLSFWDEIQLLKAASNYSSTEIETKLSENQDRLNQIVEKSEAISVRDVTDEEKKALASGEKTPSEVAETLVVKEEKTDERLSKHIAEIYIMQAQYTASLDSLMVKAKEEYLGFSENQKSKSKLVKWAGGYVAEATDLEKECDARMDEILSQISAILKETNGDMSIVDEIAEVYAEEKALKKSWYISQLEERGLI